MASSVIPVEIHHARLHPVRHQFCYRSWMYAVCLDELSELDSRVRGFAYNRWSVASINDRDYLGWEGGTLKERILGLLAHLGYNAKITRVTLITTPKVLGFGFNPVSFYLCYSSDGELRYHVAEVNNTFWERHVYVFDRTEGVEPRPHVLRYEVGKRFHVSPFFGMDYRYDVQIEANQEQLDIRWNLSKNGVVEFTSRVHGTPQPLTSETHASVAWQLPFTVLMTMPRILWQGTMLWLRRRLPVLNKPNPERPYTVRAEPYAWIDQLARRYLMGLLGQVERGRLRIVFPDGREQVFGVEGAAEAVIEVQSYRVFRRVVLHGGIGFGEAYMDGDWTSPDLPAVMRFVLDNAHLLDDRRVNLFKFTRALHLLGHLARGNSLRKAQRNIEAHYDLSNELFQLFLDPSMTYSCAIHSAGNEPLDVAQRNKLRAIAHKARIERNDHVLEIGSGWGSFAMTAAQTTGCRVTSITLSKEQQTLARERIAAQGLADRVAVELIDYRKVQGKFDKIVSIEMLEAVGHEYLPAFFESCDRLLAPDGLVVLQVITFPDRHYAAYRRRADWIQKYIFPGSHLPSIQALVDAATKHSSLSVESIENIGPHYALTLAEWRRRFLSRRADVRALGYDERFVRMWDYYLASCEAEFATRWLGVAQIVLTRPNNQKLVQLDQRLAANS